VEILHGKGGAEAPAALGRELGTCHEIPDLLDSPDKRHQKLRDGLSGHCSQTLCLRIGEVEIEKWDVICWLAYTMSSAIQCPYRKECKRSAMIRRKRGFTKTI
jgi:hypothetical protein